MSLYIKRKKICIKPIIKVNDLPFILKQNAPIYCGYLAYFDELRNATEDEKQLLLNVIKREGYKWDEENKKLVKIETDMVDGEIYYTKIDNYGEWIYIYKKNDTFETNHYIALLNGYFIEYNGVLTTHNENIKELRKSTEEEKQQLLNAIKKDGYKWDVDKKELVKKEIELVDGEIYYVRTDLAEWIYMYKRNDKFKTNHYVALMNGDFLLFDNICTTHAEDIKVLRKATEEEKRLLHYSIGKKGLTFNEDIKELMAVESDMVDGEIYYVKTKYAEWIYIYKKNYTFKTMHYVAVLNNNFMAFNNICITHNEDIKVLRKATDEEKRLFFEIIEKNGRKWDVIKKELVRIEPKFNINTLKPFDKVLTRDWDDSVWRCNIYEYFKKGKCYPFITMNGVCNQCVPYNDETKHLVGTTKMPPKKYINWEE